MKKNVLSLLKRTSYAIGLLQLYLLLESKVGWKRAVIALCYHSIPEDTPTDAISVLEGGTDRHSFECQINIFSKWLQPIDDAELLNWLNRKNDLKRDGLLVTFDDGYKNNQAVAGPILKQHGVAGLIFIPTDFITTRKIFWWTRISNLLRNIEPIAWKKLAEHALPSAILEVIADENLDSWTSRKRARRRLAFWINRQDNAESALAKIESAFGTSQVETTPEHMELLEWDDLREMQDDGFCFGSHTHTHPRLTKLNNQTLDKELLTGREELFNRLQRWPLSLAYPAGDFDERVAIHAQTIGFQMAFTTRTGIIHSQTDRMKLPRIYLNCSKPHEIYFSLAIINLAKYLPKSLEGRLAKLAR